MGTNSSKKRKKTGCGEERLTGVRHGTLERERRERKRSVGKKCAIGWTKSGPVLASEKTVVWERPHKASQTSTPSLSTSLRYSDFSRVVRKFSLEIDDVKPMYIPYEIDEVFQDQPDDLCHICSVYTGGALFTCRVCQHAYHESCLRTIGQDGNLAKFRAKGRWSCHTCDDINSLLTEEEMERLYQTFVKYNIIKGRNLLHEEILAFWKQQFLDKVASGIDLDTERRLVDVICKMDPEHNGFVTWKNFIDHESLKVLNKRNKNALLRLLTSSEIQDIRTKFQLFDYTKQGYIMKDNALALLSASEALYCIQECGSGPTLCTLGSNSQINWQQFVQMQAIYSIAARLNMWQHNYDGIDTAETRNNILVVSNPQPNAGNVVRGSRGSRCNSRSSGRESRNSGNSLRDAEVVMRDNRNKLHHAGVVFRHTDHKTQDNGSASPDTRNAKSDTTEAVRNAGYVAGDTVDTSRHTGDARRDTKNAKRESSDVNCDGDDTKHDARKKTEDVEKREVNVTSRSVSDSGTARYVGNTKSDLNLVFTHSKNRFSFPAANRKFKAKETVENMDKIKTTGPSITYLKHRLATGTRETIGQTTRSAVCQQNGMVKTTSSLSSCKDSNKLDEKSQTNTSDCHVGNEDRNTAQTSKDNHLTEKEKPSEIKNTANRSNAVMNRTSDINGNIPSGKDTSRAAKKQAMRCSSAQRTTQSLYVLGLRATSASHGHMALRRPVSMA